MLPLTDGVIDARVVLAIKAAAEDDLAARPSHHDGFEDHDHDDFDTIIVDIPEVADRVAALAGAQKILRIKGHVAGCWCRRWGRACVTSMTGPGGPSPGRAGWW